MTTQDHYFRPGTRSSGDAHTYDFVFEGRTFSWLSASGVFAARSLDEGARLLATCVITQLRGEAARVLDLGCGTGAVGVLVAVANPDCRMVMSDVNARAAACAAANARRYAPSCLCLVGEGASGLAAGTFDAVTLNPPIRAGLAVCRSLLRDAARVLVPGGRLFLVVRVKQGGRRMASELEPWFEGCDREVVRHKGYLVFELRRRETMEGLS